MPSPDNTALRLGRTVSAFRQQLVDNLYHIHGQAVQSASRHDVYMALAYTVRDFLIDRLARPPTRQYRPIRNSSTTCRPSICRASNCRRTCSTRDRATGPRGRWNTPG